MRNLDKLFNVSAILGSAAIGAGIGFQYGKIERKRLKSNVTSMSFFSPKFREIYSGYLSADTKVIQSQKEMDDLTQWARIVAADYDPALPQCVDEQIGDARERHAQALLERDRYISELNDVGWARR